MEISNIHDLNQLEKFLDSNPDLSNITSKEKRQILIKGANRYIDRMIELGLTVTKDEFLRLKLIISFNSLRKFFSDTEDLIECIRFLSHNGVLELLTSILNEELYVDPQQLRKIFLNLGDHFDKNRDLEDLFIKLDKKYQFVLEDNYRDRKCYINVFLEEYYNTAVVDPNLINYLIDNYHSSCDMSSVLSLAVCGLNMDAVKKALEFTNDIDENIYDIYYPDIEIMDLLFEHIDGYKLSLYYIKAII